MEDFKQKLVAAGFAGELDDSPAAKEFYSHDASLFEIKPKLVVFPKNTKDVQTLVRQTAALKPSAAGLSLTARSAGTDMSGGAINDSVIVDFSKHFDKIARITAAEGHAQPGVLYRDFDAATQKLNVLMPAYPASRFLCTIGGMVANNSGGEKSLEYGKTENFVNELKVVFADGNEYTVKPLTKPQLIKKMAQGDFEGNLYKKLFHLIEANYEAVKSAKPKVSKNSMGYNLWDVWDRETGVFNMANLIVGSQGTLGFVTDIKLRLVERRAHSGLLVLFMKDTHQLGHVIKTVLGYKPASFESFDDATLLLSIKFMPYFLRMLGLRKFLKLLFSLIPDGIQLLRGVPKMILMVEFNGHTEEEVRTRVRTLHRELKHLSARYEINGFEEDATEGKSEKFWIMRRHSFNLLRSKVKDKHTAPFIDDLIVSPEHLVEFLPQLRKIIKKYKLFATVQGHIGDGNFHIIPLMKLEDPNEKHKLLPAMEEVDDLVLKYNGSLSGEHNDGLIRGPWLEDQFGKEVLQLFRETKSIFDPQHIFNPHKKADATWEYSYRRIRDHF